MAMTGRIVRSSTRWLSKGDVRMFRPGIYGLLLAFVIGTVAKAESSVPYVGCPGTTMSGDSVDPPAGHDIRVDISSALAAQLAFYYGQGMYALAPRGWVCSSQSGNTSRELTIRPPKADQATGPIIDVSVWSADPAGWRVVDGYGGSYFPKIVTSEIIKADLDRLGESKGQFLVPKFPNDKISYLNSDTLEYVTPPRMPGLGSWTTGQSSDEDFSNRSPLTTYGIIGLISSADGRFIDVVVIRLPPALIGLRSVITDFSAHCRPWDRQAACAGQIDFVP